MGSNAFQVEGNRSRSQWAEQCWTIIEQWCNISIAFWPRLEHCVKLACHFFCRRSHVRICCFTERRDMYDVSKGVQQVVTVKQVTQLLALLSQCIHTHTIVTTFRQWRQPGATSHGSLAVLGKFHATINPAINTLTLKTRRERFIHQVPGYQVCSMSSSSVCGQHREFPLGHQRTAAVQRLCAAAAAADKWAGWGGREESERRMWVEEEMVVGGPRTREALLYACNR